MTAPLTRGPHPVPFPLTEDEKRHLKRLHLIDGAWSLKETKSHLTVEQIKALYDADIIAFQATESIGFIVLTVYGQVAVFGTLRHARSLQRLLDTGYTRLSLQKLGWRPSNEFELTRYDKTGRFQEVETPEGPALVAGKVTAGGFSKRHMQRVAARMKSHALTEDFRVVLLMPSVNRGKKIQQQARSFLSVLDVDIAGGSRDHELARIQRVTGGQPVSSPQPFLAGTAWHADPQFVHLPSNVLDNLQKPRDGRVEAAMLALTCDGVLTDTQLWRFFGLRAGDLPDAYEVSAVMRVVPTQRTSEREISFLTLSRKLAAMDNYRLAHRCGTAEMRIMLDIPADPDCYKPEAQGLVRGEKPDALYQDPEDQEIALEFDAGTYSMGIIEEKLTAFEERGYAPVYWGVTSAARRQNLTDRIGSRLRTNVLLAQWWK